MGWFICDALDEKSYGVEGIFDAVFAECLIHAVEYAWLHDRILLSDDDEREVRERCEQVDAESFVVYCFDPVDVLLFESFRLLLAQVLQWSCCFGHFLHSLHERRKLHARVLLQAAQTLIDLLLV